MFSLPDINIPEKHGVEQPPTYIFQGSYLISNASLKQIHVAQQFTPTHPTWMNFEEHIWTFVTLLHQWKVRQGPLDMTSQYIDFSDGTRSLLFIPTSGIWLLHLMAAMFLLPSWAPKKWGNGSQQPHFPT